MMFERCKLVVFGFRKEPSVYDLLTDIICQQQDPDPLLTCLSVFAM